MQYIGYYATGKMPFRQRQEIVIPKGAIVSSMRPGQDPAPNMRDRKIVIHHFMPGQDVPAYDAVRYHRESLERRGFDVDSLVASIEAGEKSWHDMIPVSNPAVCWPGTGGYWSEVQLNDVLAANGLDDSPNEPVSAAADPEPAVSPAPGR